MTVPRPTALPFVLALGIAIFFFGLLVSAALVMGLGIAAGLIGVTRWAWRTEMDKP